MSVLGISTTRAVERCERLANLAPPPAWWRVFALRRWLRDYRAIMALDISVHAEMLRSMYPVDGVRAMAEQRRMLAAIPAVRAVHVDESGAIEVLP